MSKMSVFSLLTALLLCLAMRAMAVESQPFVLRDYLGRSWRNELVRFKPTPEQTQAMQAGKALVGPDGAAVLYQAFPNNGPFIDFMADLNPFETREYRFTEQPNTAVSDVKVEETADAITITNHLTGVRVPKVLKNGDGPLAGIKLPSGKWVGASRLTGDLPVTEYTARVTLRGPVWTSVGCYLTLGDKSKWSIFFAVEANEPVVKVSEISEVDAPTTPSFVVTLNRNFTADNIFYRRGTGEAGHPIGDVETSKLPPADKEPFFILEPWLYWQSKVRRGNWFGLYNDQDADMLTVGALRPDLWVSDSPVKREQAAAPQIYLKQDGNDLNLTFPLKHGQRSWLFAMTDKAASLAALKEKDLQRAPLPQQSIIKHGNFPLDTVKDYVLNWKGDHDNYPRLFFTKKELAAYRARLKDTSTFDKQIPGYLRNPIASYNMDGPIQAYLATGNAELGKKLAALAVQWMQDSVDMYLKQDSLVTLGFAPHHQQGVVTGLTMADAAMAGDALTPELRERILAQAAFLGYTESRPDNWDPQRGFAANPNMTTSNYGYRATVACFIPSHPWAPVWVKAASDELLDQVNNWSDDNGGWLEAPHYAMVSYDQYLGSFLMMRNAGFGDYLYSKKMRKIIEWFAKTSTPPDSRIGGYRHKPPIGNTYLREPNGEFGIVAYLWKDKDPDFAAQMQWMFHQNNSYGQPGIGGSYPALTGYRTMLLDPAIPEKIPAYGSELFPKTGVILRSGFPTDRETQLHMIQGDNHAHYDNDSGSITLWGKGRILADDFGYTGYGPTDDHNMVESPITGGGPLYVQTFQPSPAVDFVQGSRAGWTRQILFLKDADPLKPNYFVLNDAFSVAAPATWRLWCTAKSVTPGVQSAHVEGNEDVDMDVIFVTPANFTPTTAQKTCFSGSGLYPNWQWRGMESTQTGIIAKLPHADGVTAILYPRLKTEAPPVVTTLAGGKGVKIQHAAGIDYVFLSTTPFTYTEGDITFSGTVGAIELRGEKPALFLGAGGSIAARGQSLKSDKPLPKVNTNRIANGDFETGQQTLFPDKVEGRGTSLTTALVPGNPVAGDTAHAGKYCASITLANDGGGAISVQRPIYIDPRKTYRVALKVATTAEIGATIGGYAQTGGPGNAPNPDGKGTWQYSLGFKGPTNGWQQLETTIGPAGSGAQYTWPADAVSIGLTCWFHGPAGTVYLDDLTVEEK